MEKTAGRLAIAVFAVAAAGPVLAAGCDGRDLGMASVAEVTDNAEIRLEDGRHLRLAGIEASDVTLPSLLPPLREGLPPHGEVLIAADTLPDRWGRLAAQVFLPPEGGFGPDWIQETILAKGFSRAIGGEMPADCRARLRAAETSARDAARGVWTVGRDSGAVPAHDRARLLALAGRRAVVTGTPVGIGEGRSLIFLNFGRSRYEDFTIVFSKRELKSFEAAGMKPSELVGRSVLVRGVVAGGRQPRIELLRPDEIELMDGRDTASARP